MVNFDIEIAADGVYRVSGDNEDMGVQGAKYIVDKIGTEGTIVMLKSPPPVQSLNCARRASWTPWPKSPPT